MPGTNSKMSELDCAHVLVRAFYIDAWQKRRREIRTRYIESFINIPIRCLSDGSVYHADQKFVIYTDRRNDLYQFLAVNGIDTKVHYHRALSELPIATHLKKPDFASTSVMLTRGILSLPIYPELTDDEVGYIIDKVKQFYE
jgi:dTDP-4-amino-4,6-dideoxygalactose transaminase